MMQDHRLLFATCDLPVMPLRPGMEWPNDGRPSCASFVDHSMLTDEMRDVIGEIGLNLDTVILWSWFYLDWRDHYIHTDGWYDSPNVRYTALNWLIEGESELHWYSYEGATAPELKENEGKPWSTHWEYKTQPESIGVWNGSRPALVNVRQPHRIKVRENTHRKAISMRFLPTVSMEDFMSRLGDRIITINSN